MIITRRQFLRTTIGAGIALQMPGFLLSAVKQNDHRDTEYTEASVFACREIPASKTARSLESLSGIL
ncbi:MAG: hypothetical protein JRI51_05660 [Deltaproteobacteria bacterium]|nr:hypothetical protein [Deltaproteobacteria bacterium]